MANTNSLPAYEPLCHRDREDCEDEAPPAPQHAEPTVVSVAVAGEAQAQAPEGAVSQPPAPAPVQQVPLQQSMQQTQLPPYGYPADPVVGPPMKVTQPDPLQYVAVSFSDILFTTTMTTHYNHSGSFYHHSSTCSYF